MMGTPRRSIRFTAAALITTTLLLASGLLSPSTATGPGAPEISDPSDDVNPAAFLANLPTDAALLENVSAYDLLKTYVLLETPFEFLLEFEVDDLPDAWAIPPEVPAGPNLSQPMVRLVANFTIQGVVYEAIASLAEVTPDGVRENYTLRFAEEDHAIPGAFDAQRDLVTLLVPKLLVGDPQYGDRLEFFRAEGRFGELVLDYAPNAANAELPGAGVPDPNQLVGIVTGTAETFLSDGRVVTVAYGLDYAFGNYPGGVTGHVEMSADPETQEVAPGASVTYQVRFLNQAPAGDAVFLTLSSPHEGFAHRLSLSRLFLNASEEGSVDLVVTAASDANRNQLSTVYFTTQLGDRGDLSLLTTIRGGSGAVGGQNDAGSGGDTPGAGLALAGLVALGVAAALRRRR